MVRPVRDLLPCRPGIYHLADHQGEAPAPRCRRTEPGRGPTSSTTTDYNALGTIFERAIGQSMFTEFAQAIAGPSGMRHFDPARQRYATQGWSQRYATQGWSQHRTYASTSPPATWHASASSTSTTASTTRTA